MPTIEWVGSPNFSSRGDGVPLAIVDHITAGSYPGCMNWMQNPISGASAHYLVLKNGRILQLVSEYKKAWANGFVNRPNWKLYNGTNPNNYTISIEHEALGGEGLTEAQYQASLWLHKEVIRDWKIPVDADHIIGHYRIDSVDRPNCPGAKFPWERLFKDLKTSELKDLKGETDVALKVAVVMLSKEDFWAGADVAGVADVNGNCAMFIRPADRSIPPEAMSAQKLIIIGGADVPAHPNRVYLSGKTKYNTAEAVGKYLG